MSPEVASAAFSARRLTLLFVVVGLVLAGLAIGRGEIVGLAFLPLLYLARLSTAKRSAPKLEVRRTIEPVRLIGSGTTQIELRLRNVGEHIAELEVDDSASHQLTVVSGNASAIAALRHGEELVLRYEASGHRGEYKMAPTAIAVQNRFGDRIATLQASTEGVVIVEPARRRVRPAFVRPDRTRGFTGPISTHRAGSGVNFLRVREYEPGDPLRSINWRASARASTRAGAQPSGTQSDILITNLFEQDRIAEVGIFLDARLISYPEELQPLFERSVEAATALADAFLSAGHRVSLLVYGSGVDAIRGGYGKAHLQKVRALLAWANIGDHMVFRDLTRFPGKQFPRGSHVFFVGPLSAPDIDGLTVLRGIGCSVTAVCPDPLSFTLASVADRLNESDRLAIRFARIERELVLLRARRLGVDVVDWNIDESVEALFRILYRRTGHALRRGAAS